MIKKLQSDPEYVTLFIKVYQGKINQETVTNAIASFEETLDTPSRFNDYLLGNKKALNVQELKGYNTFKSVGCVMCHNGINVGGKMFMKLGLVKDYFKTRGTPKTEADFGQYNLTKSEQEKHVFKVPTLRNIDLTGP